MSTASTQRQQQNIPTAQQFDRLGALADLRALGARLHGQANAHASIAELDETISQMYVAHDGLIIELGYQLRPKLGRSLHDISARRAAAAEIAVAAEAA